jgi:diguanylate cyclase
MNRRNRTWFSLLVLATVGSHLLGKGYPAHYWLLALLQFVVYPQLVYIAALRSKDQRRTEMASLMLDGFWLGVWSAVLGFPVWITFIALVAVTVNMTVFRGRIGFFQAGGSMLAGALATVGIFGFHFLPDTSWTTTLFAIVTISLYVLVVAESGFARALALHEARARLQQNEVELKRQLHEIGELQARLREQANRDPLTGLYNRRYFDDTLAREALRSARDHEPLSVVILDIDHFKHVNDVHGHQAGDEVLKRLADTLNNNVRGSDVASRYGGEEFVLLLTGVDSNIAEQRARDLCQIFNAEPVTFQSQSITATLSVGIASYPVHGRTPVELIRAADLAMYKAKALGRNQVVIGGA